MFDDSCADQGGAPIGALCKRINGLPWPVSGAGVSPVVLVKFAYWSQPIGAVVAVLMALGSVAAVMRFIWRACQRAQGGPRRGRHSTVSGAGRLGRDCAGARLAWASGRAVCLCDLAWRRRRTSFTLASAWDPEQARVQVVIKSLGITPARWRNACGAGDADTTEGPYGCFTFAGEARRQIWVAGGIGVTPFMARLFRAG